MKLKDAAIVRSGLVLGRKQSRDETPYQYRLLNLKSIHPKGYLDTFLSEQFYATEALNAEYLTHTGDVVIRLTAPYTAVQITAEQEGYVIPSTFVVVRVNQEILMPEFLAWLINSRKVRKRISESIVGNALGAVKPSFFADFELEILPLPSQKAIAELNRLAQREAMLLAKLAEEKEKYNNQMIQSLFSEMKRSK